MARRSTKSGKAGRPKAKAGPTKRRATTKAGRRNVRPAKGRKGPTVADLERQLDQSIRELTTAREQQAATAEVLQIISSSPGDLKPVFEAMLAKAMSLCEAQCGFIYQIEHGAMRAVAEIGVPPAFAEYRRQHLHTGGATTPADMVRATRKPAHVHDARDSDAYRQGNPNAVAGVDLGGARTVLYVPMIRNDDIVGVINLFRQEVRPFTDEQIALLENFASQAVIAIENTRLFNETQEALARQTATADILRVISSSIADARPVFDQILHSVEHLFGADDRVILLTGQDGSSLHLGAVHGRGAKGAPSLFPVPLEGTAAEIAIARGGTVTYADVLNGRDVPEGLRALARRFGLNYSIAVAPMFVEGRAIGVLNVSREAMKPFTEKECALLQTLADQAVIAIENARLFNEVQAKTRELEQSLDDLRAAQDRLVQTEKLASLGQLTAGIAHEIKNPLNFVNNFSALSVELTDELNDVLKQGEVTEKIRQEVGELTQMLKSNLEKVVQHGKRADSIVKNMLLHSREGSGERRSVDVNALVEEGLNLAYHGARAERSDFQITLERDLDPGAGHIELYPQEMTRVLLNMISNGFYAATRRAKETSDGFTPTLLVATRGLSDRVEIRIRDNGTGIPPDVKDKMFNPFFTTKPAGEGTGLGLSMSHDIVVKQHGGTIDVETEPGRFTEFVIALPRANHLRHQQA